MEEIDIFKSLSDGDTFTEALDAFIARLEAIRNKIPLDRRGAATVNIVCYGEYARAYADVKY